VALSVSGLAVGRIADDAPGPAARYETRESIQLAFVALIQQLPPRQRAIVLLCEVLGWSADEAASLLGVRPHRSIVRCNADEPHCPGVTRTTGREIGLH